MNIYYDFDRENPTEDLILANLNFTPLYLDIFLFLYDPVMVKCIPRQGRVRYYLPHLPFSKEKVVPPLDHRKHFQHFVLKLLQ